MDPIDIDFSEGEHTVLLSSPHSVEAISFPPLRFIFWWFSQLRGLPDPVLDDVDIDVDWWSMMFGPTNHVVLFFGIVRGAMRALPEFRCRIYLFRQIVWSMQWTKVQCVDLTTMCYNISDSLRAWHFFVNVDHLCIICHTSVFGSVLYLRTLYYTPFFPTKNESKNINTYRIIFSTFFSRNQKPCPQCFGSIR